jgi:hypothetical protein
LNFTVQTPVLVALAVRREGSARPRPVNDQMIPVRSGKEVALPPMTVALQPGDQLGLTLFSRHPQFNTLTLDFADGVTFTGVLMLPASHEQLIDLADPAVTDRTAVASGH